MGPKSWAGKERRRERQKRDGYGKTETKVSLSTFAAHNEVVLFFSKMLRTKVWGGRGSLEWNLLNTGLTWECCA